VTCLVDALESAAAEGHKALVFSQWTSLLDRVEPHLRAAASASRGSTGDARPGRRWWGASSREGGPPVMLVSLKAGGTGINLTAADHVFLLDPWWNPAVEDQAADRAHRIGQQRPVTIYRIVASDTVEERIVALQPASGPSPRPRCRAATRARRSPATTCSRCSPRARRPARGRSAWPASSPSCWAPTTASSARVPAPC
jgi:superfamily II DNA or RNA helicase